MGDQPLSRRRFQFRLRTLLIGVTLFCGVAGGYVVHERNIVRERLALRDQLRGLPGSDPRGIRGRIERINPDEGRFHIPWIRAQFGDVPYCTVRLPLDTPKEVRKYVRSVYPEALVCAFKPPTLNGKATYLAVRFPDEPPPPDDSEDWLPPP
jgi:hypothetical protein